ncbi:MAG: hypothetical protein COT89_02850 [Candidatus Colwellbacteria bacterium CG10_big_fil_rev_8_21_14_0_10_42_22]|uniref:Peptidase S11 D-alanyl-D-alanine carboxypeptidase A N-terminal domain-containing protein n=1 Tax=Candidatus Colwellbacteria bacterium CG10_big_fil_rev_8_21_14_0_10_42_22 TaxID=1974540 RepID=A0A2H0VFD9_9BACT|nr:MAG: hypothetical protein COT89_02850 [Candidatus Colwellbacteria bacterium CG10_big_fil_rev_8_21_14_0_10_42_22]
MDKPIATISILLAFLVGASLGMRYFGEEPILVSEKTPEEENINFESVLIGEIPSPGSGASIAGDTEPQTAVAAGAYTLSGKNILGWNLQKRWPIASITKLMSAHIASLVMDKAEVVTISQTAVDTIGDSGGLRVGEAFQVMDLLKAMLLVSSNDAAAAIAEHYGNEEFITLMNQTAEEVGMGNTRFVEPTGLSPQNQSTVEDLVRFANYIWQNDRQLLEISRRSTDYIVDINTGLTRQLVSINAFAGRADFLGGKTGSIPASDDNLLSVFSVPDRKEPVVVVVFGSQDRFGETAKILSDL